MTFEEYELRAKATDKNPVSAHSGPTDKAFAVPLYGLAGEVGTVLSLYKQFLRDGNAYAAFPHELREELGDILWYLANIAAKFGLSLAEIVQFNLHKIEGRWIPRDAASRQPFFDTACPTKERLPRWFEATFTQDEAGGRSRVTVRRDGAQIGDHLTDNSRTDDGYRFHDAFHLTYACKLGWSPVTRKLLGCKRKSDDSADNVEDGGRAIAYEEAISGLVFEHATDHGFYEHVGAVDFGVLDTIALLTRKLEVAERSMHEWEDAILGGFRIWRRLRANGGGVVRYDLEQRTMEFVEA